VSKSLSVVVEVALCRSGVSVVVATSGVALLALPQGSRSLGTSRPRLLRGFDHSTGNTRIWGSAAVVELSRPSLPLCLALLPCALAASTLEQRLCRMWLCVVPAFEFRDLNSELLTVSMLHEHR
jgi:hypothetical protein